MHDLELPASDLLRLFYFLTLTRQLDDRMVRLRREGTFISNFASGRGQEATAVGPAYALEPGDILAPSHRDVGAMLVRGMTPRELVAQWLGRDTSATRGREGHLFQGDMRDRLIVPTTGIPGSALPVAAGTALGSRLRSEPRVTLAYLGDGTVTAGAVHEALTMASALDLALVCVIEHNGYAGSMPTERHSHARHLADRAMGYGIPGAVVDGNDVVAVVQATRQALQSARAGRGPYLIEALTFHVPAEEEQTPDFISREALAFWRRQDPLERLTRYLTSLEILDAARQKDYVAEIEDLLDDALAFAMALPLPAPLVDSSLCFAPDDAPPMGPPLIAIGALTRERSTIQA